MLPITVYESGAWALMIGLQKCELAYVPIRIFIGNNITVLYVITEKNQR